MFQRLYQFHKSSISLGSPIPRITNSFLCLRSKYSSQCSLMPGPPKKTILVKATHDNKGSLKERSKDWYPLKKEKVTPLAIRIENFIQGKDSAGKSILDGRPRVFRTHPPTAPAGLRRPIRRFSPISSRSNFSGASNHNFSDRIVPREEFKGIPRPPQTAPAGPAQKQQTASPGFIENTPATFPVPPSKRLSQPYTNIAKGVISPAKPSFPQRPKTTENSYKSPEQYNNIYNSFNRSQRMEPRATTAERIEKNATGLPHNPFFHRPRGVYNDSSYNPALARVMNPQFFPRQQQFVHFHNGHIIPNAPIPGLKPRRVSGANFPGARPLLSRDSSRLTNNNSYSNQVQAQERPGSSRGRGESHRRGSSPPRRPNTTVGIGRTDVKKLFYNQHYDGSERSSGTQTPSNPYSLPMSNPFKRFEKTVKVNEEEEEEKKEKVVKGILKKKTVAERMFESMDTKECSAGSSGRSNSKKRIYEVDLTGSDDEGEKLEDPHPLDPAFIPQAINRIADATNREPQPKLNSMMSSYWKRNDMGREPSFISHASQREFPELTSSASESLYTEMIDGEALKKKIQGMRTWEYTTLGRLLGDKSQGGGSIGDGTRFSVYSFNVLSPKLLKMHPYLYKNCNPEWLDWNYRKQLFLNEIGNIEPDVLCLQEIEGDLFFVWYEPELLKLGYKGVFKKRTGSKTDGCAIFYKSSKFNLIDKLGIDFQQCHVPVLDRDNIGILVKLQSQHGRRPKLVIGTTHVLYNPKRQDVKLAQVQLLLAEMERFACCGCAKDGSSLYLPMILSGDFNTEPYSPIARFITDGQLNLLDNFGRATVSLKTGVNEFLPYYLGISDQSQHYRILLERYKLWRIKRLHQFELDLMTQSKYVNINSSVWSASLKELEESGLQFEKDSEQKGWEASNMERNMEKHVVFSQDIDLDGVSFENVAGGSSQTSQRPRLSDSTVRSFPSNEWACSTALSEVSYEEHANLLQEIYNSGIVCTFGTGELSHKLMMRNVYAPKLDRTNNTDNIATTKQSCWTTVDYIYYNMNWSDEFNRQVEGRLKLLRRYGLLTRSQCKEVGPLPNSAVPSDHFPLLAEFLLK